MGESGVVDRAGECRGGNGIARRQVSGNGARSYRRSHHRPPRTGRGDACVALVQSNPRPPSTATRLMPCDDPRPRHRPRPPGRFDAQRPITRPDITALSPRHHSAMIGPSPRATGAVYTPRQITPPRHHHRPPGRLMPRARSPAAPPPPATGPIAGRATQASPLPTFPGRTHPGPIHAGRTCTPPGSQAVLRSCRSNVHRVAARSRRSQRPLCWRFLGSCPWGAGCPDIGRTRYSTHYGVSG
jgi:hypothetical protein